MCSADLIGVRRMENRLTIGRAGEAIAVEYLRRKGLSLLARNVHFGYCEIDLVMESLQFCHIIEVKTLTGNNLVLPYERVDFQKRNNLFKATRRLIRTYRIDKEIVFDIVSVVINEGKIYLKYIPDAFSPINHI